MGEFGKIINIIKKFFIFFLFLSILFNFQIINSQELEYDSFVIIIDCSASMHEWKQPKKGGKPTLMPGTDVNDLRVTAARIFVNLLPLEDKVGTIIFYTDEKLINGDPDIDYKLEEGDPRVHYDWVFELQHIKDEKNRNILLNKLEEAKKAQGFTFINGALIKAHDELKKDISAKNKYIILLTDGSPTYSWHQTKEQTEELRREIIRTSNEIINDKISIYTILLSDEGSRKFMEDIAYLSSKNTGKGQCFFVKEASNLADAFSKIFNDTKGLFFRDLPQDNKLKISEFTKNINFLLLGEQEQKSFEVISPKGLLINDKTSYLPEIDFKWSGDVDRNYKLLIINQPEEGEWEVKKYGTDKIIFSIIEGLYLDLFIKKPIGEQIFYCQQDVPIEAELKLYKENLNLNEIEYRINLIIKNEENNEEISTILLPEENWGSVNNNGIISDRFNHLEYQDIIKPNLKLKIYIQVLLRLKKDKRLIYKSTPINIRIYPSIPFEISNIYINGKEFKCCDISLEYKYKDKISNEYFIKIEDINKDKNINTNLKIILERGEDYFDLIDDKIEIIDNSAELELKIKSEKKFKKSLFKNNTYLLGILLEPTDNQYNIIPNYFAVNFKIHSWFQDNYFIIILIIAVIIVLLMIWLFYWYTIPEPKGKLYSTTDGSTINLKHKNFFSKLLHKNIIYIGGDKKNDLIIRDLQNAQFYIRAEKRKNKNTKKNEKILLFIPMKNCTINIYPKTLTDRISGSNIVYNEDKIEINNKFIFIYQKY